jgi:hypothetical protein
LGTSFLTSVAYNGATVSTAGVLLGVLPSLFKQNVIEFKDLTNNVVTFNFNLPATLIHKKILVRATVYTACTTENTTVVMTLTGDANSVPVPAILTAST